MKEAEERNILEGNRKISDFMGEETFIGDGGDLWTPVKIKGIHPYSVKVEYHSSWDWQIPAWSKLAHECQNLASEPNIDHQFYLRMVDKYESAIFQNNPQEGHYVIVKLLNWYSKQKK